MQAVGLIAPGRGPRRRRDGAVGPARVAAVSDSRAGRAAGHRRLDGRSAAGLGHGDVGPPRAAVVGGDESRDRRQGRHARRRRHGARPAVLPRALARRDHRRHESRSRGPGTADQLVPRREYVDQLLADVNAAFPRAASIRDDDIRLVHRGLLPASEASPRRVTLLARQPVHRSRRGRLPEPLLARRRPVHDGAAFRRDGPWTPCAARSARPWRRVRTATTRLDGGDIERFDAFLADAQASGDARRPGRAHRAPGVQLRDRVDGRDRDGSRECGGRSGTARRAVRRRSPAVLDDRCERCASVRRDRRGDPLRRARGDGGDARRRAAAAHRGRHARPSGSRRRRGRRRR